MNVDPERLGLRQYYAVLHGWNAGADPEASAPPRDLSRLKRALAAHTVH